MIERRRLLELLGVTAMIGELTRYEKKTVTFPNAANSNTWEAGAIVPCSFEPKIIIFRGTDTETLGTILKGIFGLSAAYNNGSVDIGVVQYKNYATGTWSQGAYSKSTGAAAAHFKYENGNFYATRAGGNGWWNNTDTYTFEFYG